MEAALRESTVIGPAIFLSGDSYPRDGYVETALRERIAWAFSEWIGQAEVLSRTDEPLFCHPVPHRLSLLDRVAPCDGQVVLLGRSSGARVASLLAARRRVAAVVCLGYPFRHPECPPEPERVDHLGSMLAPTLILQGRDDPYGGVDLEEIYTLSPAVQVSFVSGGHEFHLTANEWDDAARDVLAFCRRVVAGGVVCPGSQGNTVRTIVPSSASYPA